MIPAPRECLAGRRAPCPPVAPLRHYFRQRYPNSPTDRPRLGTDLGDLHPPLVIRSFAYLILALVITSVVIERGASQGVRSAPMKRYDLRFLCCGVRMRPLTIANPQSLATELVVTETEDLYLDHLIDTPRPRPEVELHQVRINIVARPLVAEREETGRQVAGHLKCILK